MLAIGIEVIRSEIVYTQPKLERIEYIATTYVCLECKDTEEQQFMKDNDKPTLIPRMNSCLHISFTKVWIIYPIVQTGAGLPADVCVYRQNFQGSLEYYSRSGIHATFWLI